MFALILESRVIQIERNKFPVALPLIWVECSNNVQVGQKYIDGEFQSESRESTEQKKARIKNERITLRQTFLDNTLRESMEYLLSINEYPNKEKRERAKQEINEIQASNTIAAINKFDTVFE